MKTSTRQRENSVIQVRSSSRTRRGLLEKAAEGGQVASGSVRVCEEGPTGEPARKHSLFPKKFTLVRAQVSLGVSSKLKWVSAVDTCEKAEKDVRQVATTGLLSRVSALLCKLC